MSGATPRSKAPENIEQWLRTRGWTIPPWAEASESGRYWQPANFDYRTQIYTWEQAMAIEFHKFITLGG